MAKKKEKEKEKGKQEKKSCFPSEKEFAVWGY
jgi:hypothetical protein